MKKFQVFLGLAVLMLVLWTVATPVNQNNDSLVGAWIVGPACCSGTDTDRCRAYEGPLPHNCAWLMNTPICVGSDPDGDCVDNTGYTYDPCGDDCPGWPSGCTI
jgi:hypothetical protein